LRCPCSASVIIEARLIELAGIFSISVPTYAALSNQVHVVVRVDPEQASHWTDDQIAERWVRLFRASCPAGRVSPGDQTQSITVLPAKSQNRRPPSSSSTGACDPC
jgi:hypothetical protein